jgi:hyperosmotically inducible periplasmic protein
MAIATLIIASLEKGTNPTKEHNMKIQPLWYGAIVGLALTAGCQREEPRPKTTPAPPTAPQPAERPVVPAPQTGTTPPGGTDAGRTVGQTIDDATITSKLKTALLQAPDVKGTDVNVDTVKGAVTLKGSVETQAQADRAAQIARAAEGVREVNNQLTVKTKP